MYRLTHREDPWLTPACIEFLAKWLRDDSRGMEWGAGKSTAWFARGIAHLTSVEHNPKWYERVSVMIDKPRYGDVRLLIKEPVAEKYVAVADEFEDESLDFVLVDGYSDLRGECVAAAIPKIRNGGLLILDDAQRYLPIESQAPRAIGPEAEPLTPLWAENTERLAGWKCLSTCDGLRSTLIWRRPLPAKGLNNVPKD